ncbi:MAG: hypothetical protein Q7S62_02715 [bacterium]|nr:hypothetical protein [bacterium]
MVNSLSIHEREIGLDIFDSGMVSLEAVSWHVHRTHPELQLPPAPIFIDLGGLPQELVTKIGALLCAKAVQAAMRFDKIAGVPTGGNGFAEAFCTALRGDRSLLLTLQKTGQGIQGPVEGFLELRNLVLLVEDVITTGESTLETIEVLGAGGCIVHNVMAVIDYGLGAAERLNAKDLTLHCIFPISQLLSLWLDTERIATEQYDEVMAFFNTVRTKLMPSL